MKQGMNILSVVLGEIPMIIAVDPDVQWMEERESITEAWFNSIRKN